MLERAYPDLVRPVKLPTRPQVHTLPGVFMETPKEERRPPRNDQRAKRDERRTEPPSRDNSPGRGRRKYVGRRKLDRREPHGI